MQNAPQSPLKEHDIYCGSAVDDFGLSPTEFRVLAHLKGRLDKDGIAKRSIRSIADTCQTRPATVIAAIRGLEKRHIVTCERRPKRTTLYRINPPEKWTRLSAVYMGLKVPEDLIREWLGGAR